MNEALLKTSQALIDNRTRWLKEAITAQVLADFLPEKVQNLKILNLDLSSDGKELQVSVYGQDAYETLKGLGAEGFQPHYNSFGKTWYLTDGVMDLSGGYMATFTVHQTEKPPRCHTETRERTVTEEVAICEDTNKEL